MDTEVHSWDHKTVDGVSVMRAVRPYSLPAEVADAVYVVGDLLNFPSIRESPTIVETAAKVDANWPNSCPSLSVCKDFVTPAVIKQRYNIPNDSTGMTAANNSFAVAEFQ